MFMKMTVEEFLLWVSCYEVVAYTCYRQKKFIVTINKNKEYTNVECCVTNTHEYQKLNRALRKLSNN